MRSETTPFRVRYPEVDRMGVVHHTHYFVWFELGRTELMRSAGLPYGVLEDEEGILFPVVETGARYRRPARYDEALEVRTGIAALTPVRVRFEYRIERPADGSLLADGFSVHAAVGRDGRPQRLRHDIMARLSTWT
ncbi:MAG: acyl-CoA thioesterase [Acidobacteria bacterium]|nr:acyl-CoA thioesterase [Acidobacteriota bacterium]MCU0254703.1 acyl-CoA thioesterase [Acidobacteriota bacterium]